MGLPSVHWWALIGLMARLAVAFDSDRVFHSDEIFQYLEQAHRLVFGYGYIPWEYRFGTRSWILPGFISAILRACQSLGMDEPRIYIAATEALFCFFSILLVYTMHAVARDLAGETAGRLAAAFTCCWYELIYFAQKPNPEVLSTYLLAAVLACVVSPSRRKSLLFGLFAAGVVVLRVQYLPAIALLAFYACARWRRAELAPAALVFAVVLTTAGYIDYLTWGGFFASYYNNYLFNSVYAVSTLFGTEPYYHYFVCLTIASTGLFAIIGLTGLANLHKTWLLLSVIATILIPHSLLAHKEYRFVFATIPIFVTLLAIIISDPKLVNRYLIYGSIIGICGLSLTGLASKLPFQQRVVNRGLAVPLMEEEEILQAYLFLNKEPGLAAILNVSGHWAGTGGYFYLHHDVPIYFPNHLEVKDDLRRYVSHVICPTHYKNIPGFSVALRLKSLEIRRQTDPPFGYLTLDLDTRNVQQPGIDDKYTPTIKKRS